MLTMTDTTLLELRLWAVTYAADGVLLFELRSPDGARLPAFSPGAHVDIHLPNGLVRQYSLVNAPEPGDRYVVAVKRDPNSTGGSRYMHDELRVGTVLSVSTPRNLFPLVEDAATSVFVAGGIGISPIFCMIQRLAALARPWALHYAVRHRGEAALLDDLPEGGQVHLHVSTEHAGARLDIAAVVRSAAPDAELYCCGPNSMIHAFKEAADVYGRSPEHVHIEYFSGPEDTEPTGAFTVELARSGRTILVPAGVSITQTLREAGIETMVSCEKGVCGACETKVLGGVPDHRDLILTDEERAEGRLMMICCSGARTDTLILDL